MRLSAGISALTGWESESARAVLEPFTSPRIPGPELGVQSRIERDQSSTFRETIAREVMLLGRLRHGGVVRLYEHSVADDSPWYAMELLEGASLRHFMETRWVDAEPVESSVHARRRNADETRSAVRVDALAAALHVIERLCLPLGYLHAQGFVHADVKPENVFVCDDGRVVLLDFGAAKPLDQGLADGEGDFSTFGTWTYMAPECRVGSDFDHRVDAYAVGCILYEFVMGYTPTEHALVRRAPELELQRALGDLPAGLRRLIRALTASDPSDRPELATCAAELLTFARLLESEPEAPTHRLRA